MERPRLWLAGEWLPCGRLARQPPWMLPGPFLIMPIDLSMLSRGFVTVVTWIFVSCHRDLWQVTTNLNPAWPLSSSSHHGPFPSKTTNPPRLCWPLLQTCQSMRQLLQPGGFQRKVGTKFPAGIWLRERTLTSNLSITNIAVKGAEGG